MREALLHLAVQLLANRSVRGIMGFTPANVFGGRYKTLLARVKSLLATRNPPMPPDFDDDDRVVTHWYTKDHTFDPNLNFRGLQSLLRAGNHPTARNLSILGAYLQEALLKLPRKPEPSFRVIHSYSGFRAKYVAGAVITDEAFISSSLNPRPPFPGDVYFTINGSSGRFIGDMAEFVDEDEILFPAQLRFEILKVSDLSDGSVHVVMKEVS
jgi:NAD:arginine ADP-ribosyltransferase